jgi:hypothetical protein
MDKSPVKTIQETISEKEITFMMEHNRDPEFLYLGHYEYHQLLTYIRKIKERVWIGPLTDHITQYEGMYVLEVNQMHHFNLA